MKFFYCLKEGIDGLFRAKMSALIAVLTMAGALILIGVFAVVTINMIAIVESLRSRIELEVFVENGQGEKGIEELQQKLQATPGIDSVAFISREQAIEVFRREFGDEFIELLQSNPLPASFRISLERPYQHSVQAQVIAEQLRSFPGVDEVVYRQDFVQTLERYMGVAMTLDLLIGILVCTGSIFVIINNVRLVAYSKRRMIETMQLVGASWGLVRGPFLVQGFFHGLLGGMVAAGFFSLTQRYILAGYQDLFDIPEHLYVILISAGTLLGVVAAHVGIRKYCKPDWEVS